jgi:hypothetical protein
MTARPTKEQINAALDRAAEAARERTRTRARITMLPLPPHDCELIEERWFLIGWIVVVAEPEEWSVFYDPLTDEGRLRVKR